MGSVAAASNFRDFIWNLAALLDSLRQSIVQCQPNLAWFAKSAEEFRADTTVDAFAFVAFGIIVLRKTDRVKFFYEYLLLKRNEFPAYRNVGITDENIQRVKEVVFFYLLYLIYQVVQFPLTIGNPTPWSFVADFVIQLFLALHTLLLLRSVRKKIISRWDNDPERQAKVRKWLDARLEGLNLRHDELRGNVVQLFLVNFLPWFATALPMLAWGASQVMGLTSDWLRSSLG